MAAKGKGKPAKKPAAAAKTAKGKSAKPVKAPAKAAAKAAPPAARAAVKPAAAQPNGGVWRAGISCAVASGYENASPGRRGLRGRG